MADALLFDLDNTLASTSKLEDVRLGQRKWEQISAEVLGSVKPYKPVSDLLGQLKNKGVLLGLVTNGPRRYCLPLLNHLGLFQLFDVVVAYDDVGPAGIKPSPVGIRMALKQLGHSATQRVLYFGDETSDMAAAYAAGVTPVLGSWGSRKPIDATPALVMSTTDVLDYIDNRQKYILVAERYAKDALQQRQSSINDDDLFYLGVDVEGRCVPLRKEMTTLALGRYFTQKSPVTAVLHDRHPLSIDIERKSRENPFQIPPYWVELFSEVVTRLKKNGIPLDLVTIVPSKVGGDDRLERLLDMVEAAVQTRGSCPYQFVPDVFKFAPDAKSLKTLNYEQRSVAIREFLHIKRSKLVAGKSVLVIDDVTTSGATMKRARELLTGAHADRVWGAVLAKSVSMPADFKQCPKCGRLMKVRKNRDGSGRFWGCTGFFEMDAEGKPSCKYVVHIS